ncbi:MAG: N-acetylmuramoyl-L-alanine amidase [Treponema sp.]|nr:N-acetylmuramoyl-L-alanine amidase [Treponema sp.]
MRRITIVLAVFLFLPALSLGGQARGKSYTVEETLKALGAALSWDPFFDSGVLTLRGGRRLNFYAGEEGEAGPVLAGGGELLTTALPYIRGGTLFFPEAFVAAAGGALPSLPEFTSPPEEGARFRIAAIIIDPGHGGRDSGAVGNHTIKGKTLKSVEKDIVLAVSRKLQSLLQAAYPGKRILLTRTGDTYPSLEERVNTANAVSLGENEAIIYISIHANASLNKNARGYEVWYLTPEYRRSLIDREKYDGTEELIPVLNAMLEEEFTMESTRMARFILNRFTEGLGNRIPSRGLKAENWYVVRNARMPSVLVELGFVTNPEDAQLMADPAYLKKFSEALYKGIADFVAEFESSGGYIAR